MDLQKMGGAAALIQAATYLLGMVILFTVLLPAGYEPESANPNHAITFLVDHKFTLYAWNLVIFIINGVFLVVLVIAIHARIKIAGDGLAATATCFGLIWAGLVLASGMLANVGADIAVHQFAADPEGAAALWSTISVVRDGFGGGNELVGGLWVALISFAANRAGTLPRALNYFGQLIGVAGILTVLPGFSDIGTLFGLGCILWFIWIGIILLRGPAKIA